MMFSRRLMQVSMLKNATAQAAASSGVQIDPIKVCRRELVAHEIAFVQPLELLMSVGYYSCAVIFWYICLGNDGLHLVCNEPLGFKHAVSHCLANRIAVGQGGLFGSIDLGTEHAVFLGGGKVALNIDLSQEGDVVELIDADQPAEFDLVIFPSQYFGNRNPLSDDSRRRSEAHRADPKSGMVRVLLLVFNGQRAS